MIKKNWVYLFVGLIAVVLCLRVVHEPDLWWQLRTGEYILENSFIPKTDVFSYTYAGVDWLNVKWGFEVVQAKVVSFLGPEFLFLPQVVANLFMLFFLLKTTNLLVGNTKIPPAIKGLAALVFLIGLSYRMNGRPELVTYAFASFYLFIFTKSWRGSKNWLLALLPAQLFWANMHEGYGVGMVMVMCFIASIWYDYSSKKAKGSIQRKESMRQTAIAFASFFTVAAHPSGIQMLLHPYNIFTQLSKNTFTQEIYAFTDAAYWQFPAVIGFIIALFIAFHLYNTGQFNGRFRFKILVEKYPLFYILLFVGFLYLSLTSYRNFPLLFVVSTPILAINLNQYLSTFNSKMLKSAFITLAIIFYLSIVTNGYYALFLPNETYGIGISSSKNAVGAADFISTQKLDGPAFSDYLISSYLLWSLQPDFKTFVDLRDLDVFEAEDIQLSLILCHEPTRRLANGKTVWETVSARYNFNYVAVLNNPEFLPLHRQLLSLSDYDLVFADELSSVFVKVSDENSAIINSYGYGEGNFSFSKLNEDHASNLGVTTAKVLWPFYQPNSYSEKRLNKAQSAYFEALGLQAE